MAEVLSEDTKTYEQGLEEGWGLLKKIMRMDYEQRNNIFGTDNFNNGTGDIVRSFTAAQIKEKIEQYEKNKDCIKVGDKVVSRGFIGEAIVTHIEPAHNTADVLLKNGKAVEHIDINILKKTGDWIDICEILNKI